MNDIRIASLNVTQLVRLAEDWRISDDFIGKVVRSQIPRKYKWDTHPNPATEYPHSPVGYIDDEGNQVDE